MTHQRFLFALTTLVGIAMTVSGAQLTQVWSEEFNGPQIDQSKWDFQTGCDGFGNYELQCYLANRSENARIENGVLVIEARKENWGNNQFTSAKLTSKSGFLYGLYEIRARLPNGKNLWPAFWMLPQDNAYGVWPRSGELDLVEARGQRTYQTIGTAHYGQAWNIKTSVGTGEVNFTADFSKEFHTFGFNWDPWTLTWLLDGVQIRSENINRNLWEGLYTANSQPFDKNFYLILNLAVSGAFFPESEYGHFDPSDANSWVKPTVEVDWIRVSKWI